MSVLEIENLRFTYGEEQLYNNASVKIYEGEHVGLVGKNGSGKSTLLNLIAGKMSQDSGEIILDHTKSFTYLDQHLEVKNDLSIGEYLYDVYSDLYKLEHDMNKLYESLETADMQDYDKIISKAEHIQEILDEKDFYRIKSKIMNVINGLGIDEDENKILRDLSGGQRAKVFLAKMLLEEKDVLLSFLSSTIAYLKTHQKAVFTAAVILVLAVVLGYAYAVHVKNVQEKSWAAYYKAQLAVMANPTDLAQLNAVGVAFPKTNAAQYAQLLKGDLLYAQENYAQAADAYEPLLDAHNETLRTVATLSLAAARQATKDYEGSIKLLTQFIEKNPKSFALPQAYFTLAVSQELSGQKEKATETYKQILADYTKTYFGTVAKERLNALTK